MLGSSLAAREGSLGSQCDACVKVLITDNNAMTTPPLWSPGRTVQDPCRTCHVGTRARRAGWALRVTWREW